MNSRDQRPRVCFVAPRAYNVLSGREAIQHIGGAETQQVALARGLAERGCSVSMVTLDYDQTDGEWCHGVQVFRSYRQHAGVPGLRFVFPRLVQTWRALGRARADIYYQRTSDSLSGVVAAYCRRNGARFVFALGAMADCDPCLPNCPSLRERWLYLYGLARADCVVAQTQVQRQELRRHFRRTAVVIPSTAAEPPSPRPIAAPSGRPRFLWVGRFRFEKRPEWIAEVARRCPEYVFEVVGDDNVGSTARRELVQALQTCPNVVWHGYQPPGRIDAYYRSATALVCTSVVEGFPNTFLEAWSRGVPLVTSIDPDQVVARHRLGFCAENPDGLATACRVLAEQPAVHLELSARVQAYFAATHRLDVVLDQYESLFAQIMDQSPTHGKGAEHRQDSKSDKRLE